MTQSVDLANAINSFVKGCKTDGTWDAIKECCIMAAWDGLNGALYPLKGGAPTNIGPFVSADYDRERGLQGNGSSKALVSNRRIFDDSQNNCHLSYFPTSVGGDYTMGTQSINFIGSMHFVSDMERCRNNTTAGGSGFVTLYALRGISRSNSANYVSRNGNISTTRTIASEAPAQNWYYGIFGTATSAGTMYSYSAVRIAFYSIGEALDLTLFASRVSTLMTDIGAAIP